MTKAPTHTAKETKKPPAEKEHNKTIHEVLAEIKDELLKMEASSSHGDFRQACRDAVAVIEKYMGAS